MTDPPPKNESDGVVVDGNLIADSSGFDSAGLPRTGAGVVVAPNLNGSVDVDVMIVDAAD